MPRRILYVLGIALALTACVPGTPITIVETVVVERTVEVPVTVEPTIQAEPTQTAEPPPETKTLVVCTPEEPNTLYPFGGPNAAAMLVQEALYDGPIDNYSYAHQPVLLEKLPSLADGDAVINAVTVQAGDLVLNSDGDPVELIEGVVVRPAGCYVADCAIEFDGMPIDMDQMIATFQLLPDIRWSNGAQLTADDSVYGFELNADRDTPTSHYVADRTASYEATSNTTIVWTGLPGYVDELYYTNFWQPFPRVLWQDELGYSAADLPEAEESARNPIGWGPFTISEWVAGDHITVERNPEYFRAGEGLPYLDTVLFRFVSDANVAIAQLISGECDIATQYDLLEEQAELLLRLDQENVIAAAFSTTAAWEHAAFGINPADDYDRPDFFEDPRVRQAIAMCLNRQEAVDTVLYGRSTVIDGFLPPTHPLYASGLTSWPYDPEAGIALLEEVGWVDSNGDGVREASGVEGISDGTTLAFTWLSTETATHVRYMEAFQQDLAACGVAATLDYLAPVEYYAEGPVGVLFGRRFDIGSFAWLASELPGCEYYLGTEIPREENGWDGVNITGFDDAPYNEQCLRAISAVPGSEDYAEAHKESQRIFSEQIPSIPLFLNLRLDGLRTNVMGFDVDATVRSEMWNIEVLDLEQ